MEPYLFIDEKECKHIITTYEKDDVVDELVNVYTHIHVLFLRLLKRKFLKSLKKLKGVKWGDILEYKSWFPRNERRSKYELTHSYFKRDNSGNNASNPFHIETRWKVDWTRTPSGWRTCKQ